MIHRESSDQLEAFLKQKPHGAPNGRFLQTGVCYRQERLAQESSERFDTPSNSPLSLVLVSKQYRSLLLLSHMLPRKSLECWRGLFPGAVRDALGEGEVFINSI